MAKKNKAATAEIAAMQARNDGILDEFEEGYGDTFDASTARATTAANLYADALGVNGADGNARAQDAFQVGPGYQFAVDQGLEAVQRSAAAGGMLASGNTLDAALRNAQGYASQEYNNWLAGLSPFVGAEQAGLENRAGLGSMVATARMDGNNAAMDRTQAGINNRQQMIGNLLGFAGNIAGRTSWGGAAPAAPAPAPSPYKKYGG